MGKGKNGKGQEASEALSDKPKLWRIGGETYDLHPFLDKHPGGRRILELSRDRFPDSTHAFESFHLNQAKVRLMMKQYKVSNSNSPTKQDNTLTELNSFYAVLRQRVHDYLQATGGPGPTWGSVCLFWAATILHFVFYAVLLRYTYNALWCVPAIIVTSAIVGGYGHNWVHQVKYRNWAIIGLDFIGFPSENWFRQHLLQHHIYTNTPEDNHYDGTDPFLLASPIKKRNFMHIIAAIFMPVVLFFGTVGHWAMYVGQVIKGAEEASPCIWCFPIPWALCMWRFGWWQGLIIQATIVGVMSIWYFTIALMNHNTDHTFQDTDSAKDWGEYQLRVCSDIGTGLSFWGSARYIWLNYHTVHHLFPTTDMSRHPEIQKILIDTCDEFAIKYSHPDFVTSYRQMIVNFMYGGRHEGSSRPKHT